MTRDEAKAKGLPGWNLRCNYCGEYPADWFESERPGWGALALCAKHGDELKKEQARHAKEMDRLRTINFEQERLVG